MPSTYENLVIIINIIIVITIIVKIVVIININIEGAGVCRLWRFARGYFLPWEFDLSQFGNQTMPSVMRLYCQLIV